MARIEDRHIDPTNSSSISPEDMLKHFRQKIIDDLESLKQMTNADAVWKRMGEIALEIVQLGSMSYPGKRETHKEAIGKLMGLMQVIYSTGRIPNGSEKTIQTVIDLISAR